VSSRRHEGHTKAPARKPSRSRLSRDKTADLSQKAHVYGGIAQS